MARTLPWPRHMDKAGRRADSPAMEWREDGILLAVRRHGETAAILEVFTHGQGPSCGRGARGCLPQDGADPAARRATRRDVAGAAVGPYRQLPGGACPSPAADVMGDRFALAGLGAVCALLSFCLPERAPYPALYARSLALLDGLGAERWADAYLGWELALLTEMGFGLSLGGLRGDGIDGGSGLRLAPHGPRGVAQGRGGLVRPPAAVSALSQRGTVRLARGASGRLRTTGHFLSEHLAPSLGDRPCPRRGNGSST
jgi:DNA repair protein RecO (recombination protein O)